ncbi:MAG: hypothetical protein V4731_15225 [Pseudomonadota bacterium]
MNFNERKSLAFGHVPLKPGALISGPRVVHSIVAKVDEFDLVCFRLDKLLADAVLADLQRDCSKFYVLPYRQPFMFRWNWMVAVVRPSRDWLLRFCELLPSDVTAELCYAEVSRDFITWTKVQASALHSAVLSSLVRRRFAGTPTRYETTSYYGPRRDTIAMYHNRPHKGTDQFLGYPCLHAEIRIAGKARLNGFGLARPRDLVDYDFGKAWERACTFYTVPDDLRELGSDLGDGRKAVGDHALRKRARRFIQAGMDGDLFIAHRAIRSQGAGRIARTDFDEWIRANMKVSPNPLLI